MVFQIIGISVLLIFYGCYFLKMLHQHKQGIMTDQIGKGKTGVVKKIEITMKMITFVVPAAEFISIVLNIFVAIFPLRILGAVISIVGVLAFILSVLTMRDSWRAGVSKTDQTELITGGIYQISRNPAFLGFDLVYIGMVMMFFNLPLLILSVVAMIIFHLQIVNVEEDFLLETFGDDYIDYKKKVCRYLGRKQ